MRNAIVIALCLVASFAHAEFMMWSIDQSQFSSGIDVGDVAYMRVGYVKSSGNDPFWSGTALTTYDMVGDSMGVSAVDYQDNVSYKVDVTGLDVNSGAYSFYIELLNSTGDRIGRTGNNTAFTYSTYASLQAGNYIATGDIGTVPSVNVWHGGSFEAVPEPSSMALLALGAGLVGLRRKLRKGKKGKRA